MGGWGGWGSGNESASHVLGRSSISGSGKQRACWDSDVGTASSCSSSLSSHVCVDGEAGQEAAAAFIKFNGAHPKGGVGHGRHAAGVTGGHEDPRPRYVGFDAGINDPGALRQAGSVVQRRGACLRRASCDCRRGRRGWE